VNAAGGIGGHPVQIINIDSKADAATYVTGLKTLVADGVVAIVSADDYSEASGGPYMKTTGVPVIGASGTDLTIWGALPNYFQVMTGFPYSVTGLPQIAKALGVKTIGSVVCAEVANCLATGTIVKGVANSLGGLTYTGTLTAAQAATSYTAQCVALNQSKTGFVVTAIAVQVTTRLAPACKQQGFTGIVAPSTESFVQASDATLGLPVATNLQGFPWWVDAPPVNAYRAAMAKYQPSVDYRSGDASTVWSSLELFKYAVGTPTGTLTAATVLADMDNVKNVTLDGLLPQPFTFTAGKGSPPVKCYWPIELKVGATNPTILHIGTSGNGASGDLSSSCAPDEVS
jgi:branched-chain amino acid transport system substrate-binding protein